ncbi:MAG: hypothetical protein AAB501_00510 [Patescibacteria group bacterium]
MSNKFKKIISSFVLVSLVGFYFVSPFTVNKVDAFLGIADVSFNTTLGDIPRVLYQIGTKLVEAGLRKLKKRMLTQIQNDLVNWVQNGGEPRFIKDTGKFIRDNTKYAAVSGIDKFFTERGTDICSPFKANVQLLVNKTKLLQEDQLRCSLGDIKDNLSNFAENFENGGWTTWLKLHETRNTLPGTYLVSSQLISAETAIAGNTATAKISAGKGFLDQKKCSVARYEKYNLGFYLKDGTFYEVALDEILGARNIIRSANFEYDWKTIWPQISGEVGFSMDQLDINSVRLTSTGEFITEPIDPPGKTPHGATCGKEEIITPGSIVGEWVGGGLEKLGIDSLIGANDIASILDAVLDAAVNRAARDGLSYMKSGRGSYTQPFNPSNTSSGSVQQLVGLESPSAISLQNQMIDLRSAAEKLKSDTAKLTTNRSGNLEKLENRLDLIAGKFSDSEKKNYTGGIVNETLRGKDSYEKLSDEMDSLFYSRYGDRIDFHKEDKNPGIYLANKAVNQKLSDIWKAIRIIFDDLSGNNNLYTGKNSCKIIDYTLEPKIINGGTALINYLPFNDPDGATVGWLGQHSYAAGLTGVFGSSPRVSIEDYKGNNAVDKAYRANTRSEEFQQIADSYDSLVQNAAGIIDGLENDANFVKTNQPKIALYTSVLLDYDRAGRVFDLVKKIKIYNDALSSSKKDNDNLLKNAYGELRVAQRDTRNAWLKTQQDLLASGTADEQVRAKQKIHGLEDPENGDKGITKAISLVATSLEEIDNSLRDDDNIQANLQTGEKIDPTQLGLSVADAVAQAMDINVDSIRTEMEERQLKIGQQQTDVSNKLGVVIPDPEERKRASIEGGDSEWEKYYKNRFQLIYSAFIYDFYKNHFVSKFCDSNNP